MSGSANIRTMDLPASTSDFYKRLPVFRDFTQVADEACFRPLPDDWMVGVADVQQSTKAIRENRYKAVNMAGAAVIASVANALKGRDFPFVFGGDGASFAVPPEDAALARQALAETATWVKEDLDLSLRIGMVSVADIRAQGRDVRVARYMPSDERQHRDVFGRRHGLGRCRDEARRDRGAAGRRPARIPICPACPAAMS